MKDKTYYVILISILAVGILSTIGMIVYTAYLYEHCSIITYIGNEYL